MYNYIIRRIIKAMIATVFFISTCFMIQIGINSASFLMGVVSMIMVCLTVAGFCGAVPRKREIQNILDKEGYRKEES